MIKSIQLIFTFSFLCLLLSCGKNSPVGVWHQKAIVADGHEILKKDWTLSIKEDGTYEMWKVSRLGYKDTTRGTWKYDAEQATLTMTRENGFTEVWTNVTIGMELRVTGRDFEVIFVKEF